MAGTLTVQNIQGPASGANANKIIIPSGQTLDASAGFVPPAGSVVQVVSTEKSNVASTSSQPNSGWVDSGLSVTITPASTSSKIVVSASVMLGTDANSFAYMRVVRDSTPIFIGDASSNRVPVSGVYYEVDNQGFMGTTGVSGIDEPATTSSVTYKIQLASSGGTTVYMNRSSRDATDSISPGNYDPRGSSQITVMEIAG